MNYFDKQMKFFDKEMKTFDKQMKSFDERMKYFDKGMKSFDKGLEFTGEHLVIFVNTYFEDRPKDFDAFVKKIKKGQRRKRK